MSVMMFRSNSVVIYLVVIHYVAVGKYPWLFLNGYYLKSTMPYKALFIVADKL